MEEGDTGSGLMQSDRVLYSRECVPPLCVCAFVCAWTREERRPSCLPVFLSACVHAGTFSFERLREGTTFFHIDLSTHGPLQRPIATLTTATHTSLC